MLPGTLKMPLQEHLKTVKSLHERDLAEGWGRVVMPNALERKYPNAPKDWRWQWVFPQENRWKNTATGEEGRHHVDRSIVQKAVRRAVASAGMTKHASCHTFRHNADIRIMPNSFRQISSLRTVWLDSAFLDAA